MAFAVWITGLPGSGKSTISGELLKLLGASGVRVEYLRLDELRKKIVPRPRYDDAERDRVYGEFVRMAGKAYEGGTSVILDATAHKRAYRQRAREAMGNFIEVFVDCGLETCVERESGREGGLVTAQLYKKAMERKNGLGSGDLGLGAGAGGDAVGEVVGVDVPFERGEPDIIIDSENNSAGDAAAVILKSMKERGMI